ncbi:NTE family protein [Pustulibacterium marinum]|uniref:NTE family protein n=1 Tax=Pustulibacterium marinum TaxID=1224947 RepID=A0A1I7EXK9_9FLAO|nr:patatin-like phospholipase family protein [Pustulibacterium marinum]SFU28668.1 NTE family protein [Pustulibacterium marinum]
MGLLQLFKKQDNTTPQPTFGMVLSGGGIRALAHAGLLKALLEHGRQPNCLAGTSGGSLIAALYATGHHPDDMMAFFKETPVFALNLFAMNKPGIIDSEKYVALFHKFFKVTTFEELQVPITVTATNLNTGKLEFFDSGDLIKPLLASCALPPYFSPVDINGQLYSDGGLLNNFPYEPVCDTCDVTMGSFVNPVSDVTNKDINSTFKLLQRVISITMDSNYYQKFEKCHYVFLPPEIYSVGILDTKMMDKAFDIGYQHALKEMDTMLIILDGKSELSR